MKTLKFLDGHWICPRCKTENKNIIEVTEEQNAESVKCRMCAVYFHRIGWSNYYESADNKRVMIGAI